MYSAQLPSYLEPRKFADQERTIEGGARVRDFPRLREYRDSLDQTVRVALSFGHDEDGRKRVHGCVETRLVLVCQRCLEPFEKSVVARVNLTPVWSEDQARVLPAELDPLLMAEDKVPLIDVVEEELLLALPLVALHDECPNPLSDRSGNPEPDSEPDNPFAVLASLKGRHK